MRGRSPLNFNSCADRRRNYRDYLCSADVGCVVTCDNWNYSASYPCLYVGGSYDQNGNHGLFYVNYNTASNTNADIGCRNLLSDLLTNLQKQTPAVWEFSAQVAAHPLVKISKFGERVSTPFGALESP